MHRIIHILLLMTVTACGSGGTQEPAPPVSPSLTSLEGTLDGRTDASFDLRGTAIPGSPGTTYTVRFRSAVGPLFNGCDEELVSTVAWISNTVLRGVSPITDVLRDGTAFVTVDFPEGAVTSLAAIAQFVGTPNASIDQDGNGVRDSCDPNTYDFESDDLGAQPSEVTHLGEATPLEVVDVNGDRVARYAGGSNGSSDRLDRLQADFAQQDTTVYVDWEDNPGVGSIELWSQGSFSGNAGAGLIVQIRNGLIYFFERLWRSVPSVVGPALPANGRMRIRLRKGPGTTSELHVDSWDGTQWSEDLAVFPIAVDTQYRGRAISMAAYSASARGIKRITATHTIPSGALTLATHPEGLSTWKLFQRNASDTAVVPVEALYRLATPGRLEARVVQSSDGQVVAGHDWSDHRIALAAADGARAQMALSGIPVGGNYDVRVRLTDADGNVIAQQGVNDIAVGDIYVCAGQSNMSGYSGNLTGATSPLPEVHRFHNDGRWSQAIEPIDDGSNQVDRVSLETPVHSLMLPFARALFEATGVPTAVVPTSLGGTNLHTQWQRNAATPGWRATLYGSMWHRARIATGGLAPAGFLWFQGESDAAGGRTQAQYTEDLERLLVNVRADFNAPTMLAVIAQLGTFGSANLDLWLAVQEAERQVVRNDARTALVTTVDATRSDIIHFSVAGYQAIGQRFAEAVRVLRFSHTIDPLTELVSASVGASNDRVDLTYDAAVSGGDPALFSATDDAGALTVTSIEVNGVVVTLIFDRALDANATVDYGRATAPSATWLRDVNDVPVPCFFQVPVN